MNKSVVKKIFFGLLPLAVVVALSSLFVSKGMAWFSALVKPSQWVSGFVIPVVWSIIYSVCAIILLLWIGNDMPKSVASLFAINGVFNVLWCLVFFTLHQTFVGQIAIIINLVLAVYLVLEIKKSKPQYFYALLVYPIWLCIAVSLNTAVWILN